MTSAAPLESFIQVVGVLITLSVASERLVEVMKGYIPWLGQPRPGEPSEAQRRSHILVFSMVINLLVAWLAWDLVKATPAIEAMGKWSAIIGLGLLSSGGSSMWNSVLSWLVGMKDIKQAEAKVAKVDAGQTPATCNLGAIRSKLTDASMKGALGGVAK